MEGGQGFQGLADFEKWIETKYKNNSEDWEDFKGNTLYSKESGLARKMYRKYLKEKYDKSNHFIKVL